MRLLLMCVAALLAACAVSVERGAPPALAIVGATLIASPEAVPLADSVVLARGGRIVAAGPAAAVRIPEGARVLSGRGLHLVAGFQNSHVHFTEPRWFGAEGQDAEVLSAELADFALRWGFTTVVDLGSDPGTTLALRRRIEAGEVAGPRILTAGIPFYPVDGIPWYLRDLPPAILARLHTPHTPEEALRQAAAQLDAGTDLVKLFSGSGMGRGVVKPMAPAIARGAAGEAHRRGRLVFAHASNDAGLASALAAGADVIAHALDDPSGAPQALRDIMLERRVALVPTLKLFGGLDHIAHIQRSVGDYARAGGEILFGTDAGFIADADPTEEYALMAGAHLDGRAILAALTTAPAARLGEAKRRGRVEPGMDADLVLLEGDPLADPRAFSHVRATVRGGRVVYP